MIQFGDDFEKWSEKFRQSKKTLTCFIRKCIGEGEKCRSKLAISAVKGVMFDTLVLKILINIPVTVWEAFGAAGIAVLGGVYIFKNLAMPEIPDFVRNNKNLPEAAQPWYASHMTSSANEDIHATMENTAVPM